MDRLIKESLEDSEAGGIYSKLDEEGISVLLKSKFILEFNLLCSKVCFPDYKHSMTQSESDCHDKCFRNMYSSLLYCQRKLMEENGLS